MRHVLTLVVVVGSILIACGDDSGDSSGTKSTKSVAGGGRPLPTEPKQGIATFYDADGSGNCSFDRSPGDLDVTAMALPEYDASATCGACLKVTGPKGEIIVRVVDSCPPCEASKVNLDLSAQAFAKIADPDEGRVAISYRLVSCATSGNIAYHFKDGSSQYWTAIQIRNHRVPIAKVEYQKGSSFIAMERADYNYFIEKKGVGAGELVLRVTSIDGQVIEDRLPGVEAEKTVTGTKQFE